MTKTIVNLTLPAVAAEIEEILETYPHHPYQQAFSIPDVRQELIAHVLSQISSYYAVLDDAQKPSIHFNSLPGSLKEKSCIISLIHQEIEKIFNQKEKELSHHIPEEVDASCSPSHWFG
ncbi:MAG: hypothetical protein SAK29_07695 [Scytonema sp. PMC 1069.18]|nr:hypothetical protein [Scytonema sp. PMC 1069.18]MEC4880288.1 hypothetical protein [Scytonema sp. PMC 1070.18]